MKFPATLFLVVNTFVLKHSVAMLSEPQVRVHTPALFGTSFPELCGVTVRKLPLKEPIVPLELTYSSGKLVLTLLIGTC